MTNETAQVKPTNSIVWDSINLHMQTKKVETATSMYPGRLVKVGTNDDDVVVATAASDAYGWLGYEHTTKKHRPATVDTIYLASAQVAIVNGPGIGVLATLAPGSTVTKGEELTAAADGMVTPGVGGTDDIVARAEEAVTTTGSAADIMVRSMI